MVKVNWTFEVLEQLEDIAQYHEKYSVSYASMLIERILSYERKLKEFPKIGRIVPEYQLDSIREIIYKNYRIVYRINNEKEIDVIAVHHSSSPLI